MIEITEARMLADLMTEGGHVLVDFFADWCGPCQALKPVLEEVRPLFPNIDFAKVNVESEAGLALGLTYGVRALPTLILFRNGGISEERRIGFQTKEQLIDWLGR